MILVTGGCGFLGRHVVQRLLDRGETVRVFDLPETAARPRDARVDFVPGDIRDRPAVRRAVAGCAKVMHLAANPNLWTRRRADFDAVNRLGTIHVLEEALAAGAERVLHTSTESILAESQVDSAEPLETAELNPDRIIGPYCRSKFEAERFALGLARGGAPVIVANPTLPIGPGDIGLSPPTRMTVRFCQGKLPGFVDFAFNMIDARDVADGLIAALERGEPGRRHLLGAHNLWLIDWLSLVGKAIGRKPPSMRVPVPIALLYAWFAERWADLVSGAVPDATVTGVLLAQRSMTFDAADSLARLGVRPRPLEESIADAVAWYREVGWI